MSRSQNSEFHIVRQVTDWSAHEAMQERARLPQADQCALSHDLEQDAERFRPPPELLNAINAALVSQSPLLLTGDPGTGKTQTAWFLKRYFGVELYAYQVRSTSVADDLRYNFDAVAYLRDAYLAAKPGQPDESGVDDTNTGKDPRADPKYLKPGPLWRAYDDSEPCVLLIDEIDKAPRDFPNDLLQELAEHQFAHPFHTGELVRRKGRPPITVITSNGERRLPDAFLRRCIVHHLRLDDELLEQILNAWRARFIGLDIEVEKAAVRYFKELHGHTKLSKRPGVAELLVWLSVLAAQGTTAEQLKVADPTEMPGLNCLIKDHEDLQHL